MTSEFAILHTIASLKLAKGGPSISVSRLCETLSGHGLEVDLMTQEDSRTTGSYVFPKLGCGQARFASLLPSPLGFGAKPDFQKVIISEHRYKHYKVIHDHGLWLPWNHAAAAVSRRLGIPFIINPRGMLEPWALAYKGWKKRIAWRLYQRRDLEKASLLVATSAQEAAAIRRAGLKNPVALIPNGVDMPLSKSNGRSAQTRTALFLSRIHPGKGLLTLVAAWAKVRPANWKVIVAGPDEANHRRDVEHAIAKAGLKDRFSFEGAVSDRQKADLYRCADLFILPSFSENFGVVVAEALSYGVPVITTKGTPWEGLIKHQCGWWVDIRLEALVAAIGEATALSSDERREMGERGRRFVEKEFSWHRVAEEMLNAYRWVFGQAEKPANIWGPD